MLNENKRYITDMSMKELFEEYVRIGEKCGNEALLFVRMPEGKEKDEQERFVQELYDCKKAIAFEIADRLTS